MEQRGAQGGEGPPGRRRPLLLAPPGYSLRPPVLRPRCLPGHRPAVPLWYASPGLRRQTRPHLRRSLAGSRQPLHTAPERSERLLRDFAGRRFLSIMPWERRTGWFVRPGSDPAFQVTATATILTTPPKAVGFSDSKCTFNLVYIKPN
ncbi:hypothetical protein NDU88_002629 [Pleurodeles waltl]|uniref:Uncharacterized protein n=1 Tax=Pleurodeles waltl TaxID=8319 RepID=A0AAV7UY63_PLEWA|nr:hypothetical protein NDU88_002629 [Pleurodeles waltl]